MTLGVGLFISSATDPTTFGGAVFAGWIGGYLIFVLGLVSVLVSLARPEQDFFLSRARALLRGQEGRHIDYITAQMSRLFELYTESITKEIRIVGYDQASDCFRIVHTSNATLRSYLNDISCEFEPHFTYRNATPPPDNGEPSKLAFIRVNGIQMSGPFEFTDSFDKGPYPTQVEPNSTVTVEHKFHCWVRGRHEPNRHSAKRFAQKLQVSLVNDLPDREVNVLVEIPGQPNRSEIVRVGEAAVVVNLTDIEPGQHVYDLRLIMVDSDHKSD